MEYHYIKYRKNDSFEKYKFLNLTSLTRNADASENTGASSLMSVTLIFTVAVEDIPPTSVALTS